MDKLDQLHRVLKILISPVKVRQTDLQHSLRENVRATLDALNLPEMMWLKESTQNIVMEGPTNDACWDFTSTALKILITLCDTLVARSKMNKQNSPSGTSTVDIMGVRLQSDLRTALQLVACLGIGRNLMPGVGVPLQRRTQFGHLLDPSVKDNSDYEKHVMLYATVTSLHSCCRNATLASLILTKHVDDLLAALCQLCFAPLKKSRRPAEESKQSILTDQSAVAPVTDKERVLEEQLVKAEEHRSRCLVILPDVLGRTFRPTAIKELLMLQGTPNTSDSMVPAPQWLRKATQNLLNEIMIGEHGLIAIIQGITDNTASELESGEWQICKAIAKIIANRIITAPDDCRTNLASQVLQLPHMKESSGNRSFPLIVSSVISLVDSVRPDIAKRFLLEPLFKTLVSCAKGKENSEDKEFQLTECLVSLHAIYVIGKSPNDEITGQLTPILRLLFKLHSFLLQTASGLRLPIEELLVTYLRHVETAVAVDRLMEVLFASASDDADDDDSSMLTWNPCLEPHLDDEAGVSIVQIDESVSRTTLNWLETDLKIVSSIVAVLSRLNNDVIIGKLFLRSLENLSGMLGSDLAKPEPPPEDCRSDLIRMETGHLSRENHIRRSLLTLNLLSSLCHDPALQESILKDTTQTLQFVNATLERGAVLCSSQSEDLASMESESLTMAMGILTLMLEKQDKDVQRMAMCCVPHLRTLKSKHSSEVVSEMAERLLIAIAMNASVAKTKATQKQPRSDAPSRFQQAWEDIFDEEVPLRGHAILVLKELILSKDKETMDHCDELFVALRENLKHADSYIYLVTVDGLVALASALPDKVVPILTEEYGEQRLDSATRMKLGEVLVKVTRSLGAMVPKYRDRLLNAFLTTCRDEDPLIRSSSLSNLGEACKELRFALGNNVHEIFNCLSAFGKNDSNVQVRRAAVQVIVLLLRGLGKEALMALEWIIKDIYALLKFVYDTDKDDVVKLHAQLGLDELQVVCREFLFPQTKLEKRIKVFEP